MNNYINDSIKTDLTKDGYTAVATRLTQDPSLLRKIHASIGMAGEAGEVADILKKEMMYGKVTDKETLVKECGDILWYMAIMLDEIGSSFEEVMEQNVIKLKKRYPQGFTEKDAISRKDMVNETVTT